MQTIRQQTMRNNSTMLVRGHGDLHLDPIGSSPWIRPGLAKPITQHRAKPTNKPFGTAIAALVIVLMTPLPACHILNNAAALSNSMTVGTEYEPQQSGESLEDYYHRTGLIPGSSREQSLKYAQKRGWE